MEKIPENVEKVVTGIDISQHFTLSYDLVYGEQWWQQWQSIILNTCQVTCRALLHVSSLKPCHTHHQAVAKSMI